MTDDPFMSALLAELPSLRRHCLNLTRRKPDDEDLAQEAVASAIAARHRFTPGTSMGAWLYTIARNCMLNESRRRRSKMQHVTDEDAFLEAEAKLAVRPAQEDRIVLRDALRVIRQVPSDIREAFISVRMRGESHEDYAARVGVPINTSKSRVRRMDERLRAIRTGNAA